MSRFALVPTVALALLVSSIVARVTPASAGPPASVAAPQPVNLVALDGLTTLEVWPALDPAGAPFLAGAERPAVLVLPGWNTTASDYQDLAAFLSGRGYVVAIYAHEENVDEWPADWSVWAEEALDLLVAETSSPASPLFHEIDATKIGIVGHSLGGAVATLLAAEDPRLKAVVLCGPQAGDTTFLQAARLVTAPLLTIDGSLDRLAPPSQCSDVVVANAASVDKASIVILGGNHTNCPADFDFPYIRDTGRWVTTPVSYWPFVAEEFVWPIVPGITPIPGAQQRATAYPYLGAWLDLHLAGQKDPGGYTNGDEADAQVQSGVLTSDSFSAAARKGP